MICRYLSVEMKKSPQTGQPLSQRARRTLNDLAVIQQSLLENPGHEADPSGPNQLMDLELAAELKSEVEKTDANATLSLSLIKKAQEIEKLAKQILSAAKRVSNPKKRSAGSTGASPPSAKRSRGSAGDAGARW